MQQTKNIQNKLQQWYANNKRELPWRDTKDPYKIWLSEIILQQTRVNQGFEYYIRFTKQYPDVSSLALADEKEVLKLWQGLGYYTRARNLHKTAKVIKNKYNGIFPTTYEEILVLPGIGHYTAAAIASFAFNHAYAVVDGNVFRLLARLMGDDTPINTSIGKKNFTRIAQELLDPKNPGEHNQAMMDFGAMQCRPNSPDCDICPLQSLCIAYKRNLVNQLPQKQGKIKVRARYFNYFYILEKRNTYLQKRTGDDIWKNLYQLPMIETHEETGLRLLMLTEDFKQIFSDSKARFNSEVFFQKKHILSHQKIYAKFYIVNVESISCELNDYIKIATSNLHEYPVSKLTELFFERLNTSSESKNKL